MSEHGKTPLPHDAFEWEDDILWIMHCSEGPIPHQARQAVGAFLERETKPWRLRWVEDFIGKAEAVRRQGARLLDGREQDVSMTATTSTGLVSIAQGLRWREGDEILVPLGEFPSNAWPWLALSARGVSVREVPLWDGHVAGRSAWQGPPPRAGCDPETRLIDAIGPRTRLVAASWVRFQDGLRLDLARLAAGVGQKGVPLVIDGIQGAGTLPVSLEGVSAFASGGHKGLLAPQGLGLLWTDEAFRERLVPSGSWLSVEDATDFGRPSTDLERPWLRDGRRLECGVPNLVGAAALEVSLRLINQAGVDAIASHVAGLQRSLLAQLADSPTWAEEAERLAGLLDEGRLGAILGLHHGDAGAKAWDTLLREGFSQKIYASVREGYLRVALHGWHREQDLERIADWLIDEAPAA